ncbi:4'-phosphopantetheinyl transferase superfamily protein [Klenkia sp. PcliD-1-E]|uniref:4'-phosphopantetheinyl transferase family protein n=1 Tax=Klenkia sp. PcliD-1-E TaxID=2954492 RepID=UPI0020980AD7|nr:4'-phosphopantetheinyl transferase superfamily protein [Klenkia sp. PcliD-1-E]MCO7221259.1 4'-phosphopantetheinyl transferase superfamily protein [Klenkia sp. PcliD-1-E]
MPLTTNHLGRPVLDCSPDVDVSCSRRDGLGLVAVAVGARIGVDVERVVPWTGNTVLEGWLSPTESADLLAVPPPLRPQAAARSWAEKEAVLKAVGTGLLTSPRHVPTTPGRATRRVGTWTLLPVTVPEGFEAVLATSAVPLPVEATISPTPLSSWTAGQLDVA